MGVSESVADQDRKIANARLRLVEYPDRAEDIGSNILRLEVEKADIIATELADAQAQAVFGKAINPDYRELSFDIYVVNMFQQLIDDGDFDLENTNPELYEHHLAVKAMTDKIDVV